MSKQKAYEQGQKDGSKAGVFNQMCHGFVAGTGLSEDSDAYDAGYKNGVENQPEGDTEDED